MTTFVEWLGQVGLGHCSQQLVENGIDFDVAPGLTEGDLRSLGLNLGDSRRLLHALRLLTTHEPSPASAESKGVAAAAQTGRTATDEQRLLTVMFCDLVNYTDLAQRIDAEELKGIVRAFRRVCTEVVVRYDGHVAQYMGDGLMVYFGWPAAHEDDSERCVRAALDIVQAIKSEPLGEPLAVHIGVATGRVIVGDPHGSTQDDGLAVGETPNLAARLQSLAGADEIVIGATTRRLIGNTFELADLGTHMLKGIVRPVQAWRVQGVVRGEGRFDAAHSGLALTALVDREEEVAMLQRRWAWARGGEGQVVLLSGEPGIGKSRLTQALREQIKGEPYIAVRYQCSSFCLNSALFPIIEQLEFAAAFARDDTPEEKLDKLERVLAGDDGQRTESAPLLAALLSLPTDRYPPLGLSARKQKERTLEVLAGQVEALSRVHPVLMIFEDAHWIDPTSQELLDVLVPRLRRMRVLLIVTHRPQYRARWREYTHVSTLALNSLPQRLGAELVSKVTDGKALPSELLQQIVARSDGIPLFIEELTRTVLESQLLREEDDRYTLVEALPPPMVPTTLSASLIERLGRRPGVRELAQIGSCLGREFPYELLAAVSPFEGPTFEEELQQLTATGLVFRRGVPPDAVYTFKHALVQDAAYDSLVKAKRQQLHARIAEVLSASFPERVDAEPELLAHHHTRAGHLKEAIPFWRRAGEAAQARVALQEAVAYLQNGLTAVEKLAPSPERDDLELSLRERLHSARLQWHGWAAPDVGVNAESILRLAEKRNKPRSVLIGLWGKWVSTLTQGRVAEAPVWARRLLAEGTERREIDMEILGHRGSMFSHFYLGELEAACVEAEKALELYDPSRAGHWIGLVGNDVRTAVGVCLSQALWMRGEVDRAAQVSDEKDADARRLGHPFDIGWALTWGAYVFDYRREPDRLLAHAEEADRLARDHGIPLLTKALVPVGRGLAQLRMGRPADAAVLLKEGMTGWTAAGGHLNVPYMKSALAEALALQGNLDQGLQLVGEALAQIERAGWHERVWQPEALRLKGWMLVLQGSLAEAEEALRTSIVVARDQQAKSWELRSATTLAELHLARGQRDAARSVLGPIYRSFAEGFATHDLQTAQAVLEKLG